MVTEIIVNIGSGNGFGPDGTKTLPEPTLIISEALSHSSEGNFAGNAPEIYPWYEFEND